MYVKSMTQKKNEAVGVNIDEILKKLEKISIWFDQQKEPSIEEGLKQVEEAARLIEQSRYRLVEIENRFEKVEKIIKGREK